MIVFSLTFTRFSLPRLDPMFSVRGPFACPVHSQRKSASQEAHNPSALKTLLSSLSAVCEPRATKRGRKAWLKPNVTGFNAGFQSITTYLCRLSEKVDRFFNRFVTCA